MESSRSLEIVQYILLYPILSAYSSAFPQKWAHFGRIFVLYHAVIFRERFSCIQTNELEE